MVRKSATFTILTFKFEQNFVKWYFKNAFLNFKSG